MKNERERGIRRKNPKQKIKLHSEEKKKTNKDTQTETNLFSLRHTINYSILVSWEL